MFDPTTEAPSLHDLHTDAHVRVMSLPADEYMQDADAFPPEPELTPEDEERMYAAWLADQAAERNEVPPLPELRTITRSVRPLDPEAWKARVFDIHTARDVRADESTCAHMLPAWEDVKFGTRATRKRLPGGRNAQRAVAHLGDVVCYTSGDHCVIVEMSRAGCIIRHENGREEMLPWHQVVLDHTSPDPSQIGQRLEFHE